MNLFFLLFQVLLQDIKIHGSFVTSLIKQYELQAARNKTPILLNSYDNQTGNNSLLPNHSTTTTNTLALPITRTASTSLNSQPVVSPLSFTAAPQLINNCIADASQSPRETTDTPRDSVETVTPRENTETYSTNYSTAASTPRELTLGTPREETNSLLHKTKKSRTKKAKNLEKRYHQLYLRALEWQCLIEQEITQSKVCTFFYFILIWH